MLLTKKNAPSGSVSEIMTGKRVNEGGVKKSI